MKVCLATAQFASPLSGVGTYARSLASGLARQGIDVSILCPGDQIAQTPGLEFRPVRMPTIRGHARWLTHAHAFGRALRSESGYDLVHFIDGREGLCCPREVRSRVGTVHDYYFTVPAVYWRERRWYPDWPIRLSYALIANVLEQRAYRRLSAMITNSEATRRRVLAAYSLPPGRLRTVYIGLDLGHFVAAPEPGQRSSALLFVGGNPYRKGLGRVIRCLKILQSLDPDVELLIAGTNLPRPLRTQAIQLGVLPRITCVGSVYGSALASLYRRAKVLAVPGLTEAFGLVFLEAMASRCPVVGPTDGGAAELIKDGETGFLIPPDDDGLLGRTVTSLWTDSDLRRRIVDRAAEHANGYTVDRMAIRTAEVYEAVAKGFVDLQPTGSLA